MKKLGRVAQDAPSYTRTAEEDVYRAHLGQSRRQVAYALKSYIESFLPGNQNASVLAQSAMGKEFQRKVPHIHIQNQFYRNHVPLIEINVDLMTDEDANLEPGFSFDAKLRRRITRVSGKLPVRMFIIGNSEEETTRLQAVTRLIFGRYIHRTHRGLIYNPAESWQIGFPKKLDLSGQAADIPSNATPYDEQYFSTEVNFLVDYDAVFAEKQVMPEAKVCPGESKLKVSSSGVDSTIRKGEVKDFMVMAPYPVLTYYAEDSSMVTANLNSSQNLLKVFGRTEGETELVVKDGRTEVRLTIRVV